MPSQALYQHKDLSTESQCWVTSSPDYYYPIIQNQDTHPISKKQSHITANYEQDYPSSEKQKVPDLMVVNGFR